MWSLPWVGRSTEHKYVERTILMKLRTGQSPGNRHWACERPTTKTQACVQNKKKIRIKLQESISLSHHCNIIFYMFNNRRKCWVVSCISFLATVIHFISCLLLKTMPSTHWEKRWKCCVGHLWWREYFSYLPGCRRKFISSKLSCSGSDRCLTYPSHPLEAQWHCRESSVCRWGSLEGNWWDERSLSGKLHLAGHPGAGLDGEFRRASLGD